MKSDTRTDHRMSKPFYILIICLGSGCLYFSLPSRGKPSQQPDPMAMVIDQQDNQQPVVQIKSPKDGETYLLGSRVPYSLSISDPEDGESKYEEIARNQVLLRIVYAGADNQSSASDTMRHDPPGLLGILGSNCLNCHAFKGKLIGPSFLEISKEYQAGKPDMALMASRVKNGSSGVWGPVVMPAHPELSDKEIEEMLLWITKEGDLDRVDYYVGTEGSLLLTPPGDFDGKEVILLTASYTDKGLSGKDRLRGEDRITIRVAKK